MNTLENFEDFFVNQVPSISLSSFAINFIFAAILSTLLRKIYLTYGKSLSNRDKFSRNFFILTTTTMLIITIVKSSLALSLGLVGALSIVRFRAAIKEPEELAYLFLTIALGLGFGAGQTMITTIGFALITSVLVFNNRNEGAVAEGILLSLSYTGPNKPIMTDVTDLLSKHALGVKLKRLVDDKDTLEATFLVEIASFKDLDVCRLALKEKELDILILDDKGLS